MASNEVWDGSHKKTYGIAGRLYASDVFACWKSLLGQEITIGGWIKKGRIAERGTLFFLEVNDGSSAENIQCKRKVDEDDTDNAAKYTPLTKTGASILLRGKVVEPPPDKQQAFEIDIVDILHAGHVAEGYPIAKGRIPLETLRSTKMCHLRARTNAISAVARVRDRLAQATHRFFSDNGFLYLHTPLITASDCEGAGEMFQVTTLFAQASELMATPMPSSEEINAAEFTVETQTKAVQTMKDEKRNKKTIKEGVAHLNEAMQKLSILRERVSTQNGVPCTADGKIDFEKDFFGRQAYLTVSGQLQGESYACSMGNIYTFGPTFRAENSNTTRHLAEFWMIEPEMAFCDLHGLMDCAEDYVRYCCQYVLKHCFEDLVFFAKFIDKTCMERVRQVAQGESSFVRLEYKDAVQQLLEHQKTHKFETPVEPRIDLATEHERYLTEVIYKKPAFYMRQNDDDFDSVAAMDILVPKVGELVGGSQREERLEVLRQRIAAARLAESDYEWYLDLRRFGTVPHSGFGLGFERLILFVTGMENIRDAIPYPRYPGHII
eukprot:gene3311-5999_t